MEKMPRIRLLQKTVIPGKTSGVGGGSYGTAAHFCAYLYETILIPCLTESEAIFQLSDLVVTLQMKIVSSLVVGFLERENFRQYFLVCDKATIVAKTGIEIWLEISEDNLVEIKKQNISEKRTEAAAYR